MLFTRTVVKIQNCQFIVTIESTCVIYICINITVPAPMLIVFLLRGDFSVYRPSGAVTESQFPIDVSAPILLVVITVELCLGFRLIC